MAVKTIYHKVNSEGEFIEVIGTAIKKNWDYLLISGVSDRHYWGELKEPSLLHQIDFNPSITQEILTLPKEIGSCTKLKGLVIHRTKISILPPEIGKLENLEVFDVFDNDIAELPAEIVKLRNLQILDLRNNRIEKFPMSMDKLSNLKILRIRNNPIPIPLEISRRIEEPKAIFNYYYTVLIEKRRQLNEVKLIFVGQGSVGKTSLVQKILYNTFDQNQTKTEGISINQLTVEQESSIKVNIWDFGGQEIMHATHQFFLTKRSLYLLVLDSRLTQEENRVEYWLKIIQSFSDDSPVLIVGNKTDQHPLDIDRTGLQKKYPNIVGILETSAATGAGIEALKAAITEQVNNLPHVRDLLPETWFAVKTKLEGLGRESNFITHDKYLDLCAENDVSDETSQRTLIGFLHDLGVILYFQDDYRLSELGILNPQWVTNGVYKIVNSPALFQNKGVLTVSMLDEILNQPEYPRSRRLSIVDLMKRFELCYDLETDKTFLVPDLLPKDKPAELKFNGIPAFEYTYPVLRSSVITRFIVRMNQKIDDGLVWRTGVMLKIGENKALVKADIEDRKITIAIDGLEHTRRDALSAIRYQLDEIHASIKGLDAQKRVPVPNAPNAEPLEYDYLLMLEREGDETCRVKDGGRLVTVNVRQILSGIESEMQRKETANRVINIYGDVKDSNILAGDENEVKK
ncbi:MAG TPA: COR domain-containing protein [Anaerolineales bacterium]|nr:COR domain-containing protein [Anaerolineales bacterium]